MVSGVKGGPLDEELTATLIMRGRVESVVQLRRFGELRDGYAREIASCRLRRIGLDPPAVAKARAAAEQLSLSCLTRPRRARAGTCPIAWLAPFRRSRAAGET